MDDNQEHLPGDERPEAAGEKASTHFPEDNQQPAQPGVRSQEPGVNSRESLVGSSEQPETANMEVHKHPHHVTHKKKWSEYALEFLMLFLAVFLGFLVENFREHQVEHEREKQYMESLIRDLRGDTANLKNGFHLKDERLSSIDSVFIFFEANPDVQKVPGYLIKQMRRTLWDRRYRRNSTTIDQLKNAGGLRMIRNNDVRDSIAAYDLKWQRAEFWVEKYDLLQEKGKDYLNNIMDAKSAIHEYRRSHPTATSFYYNDSVMTSIHTVPLNQYINFLNDQKITTAQDKINYMIIEQSAERLIELIKKEYHLE